MKVLLYENEVWCVGQTARLSKLSLGRGARLSAPEGKRVTLVVDGVQLEARPGEYSGEIVVAVTDAIPAQLKEHGVVTDFQLCAALCVESGAVAENKSVLCAIQADEITGEHVKGAEIVSKGPDFNGIYVCGNGNYTIRDAKIDFEGNGGDDFVGFGAAITASDNVYLVVERAKVRCRGAMRSAVVCNQHSTVCINDSELHVYNGTEPNVGREQKRVPWMLGLKGNCRATNAVDYSTVVYRNCHITSENWGVLSTDATQRVRLEVWDSVVENTGDCGYGAYSIGDCCDMFSGTRLLVKDYGLIIANGRAGAVLKGSSQIQSGRFGVMWHSNQGGTLLVEEGSKIRSKQTAFLIKGCGPNIQCRDALIQAENGVLLQLMDNDDPGSWDSCYETPQGEDLPDPGRVLTEAKPSRDPIACFSGMELNGDFYNSTTSLSYMKMPFSPAGLDAPDNPGGSNALGAPDRPDGQPDMLEGMLMMPMGGPLNLELQFSDCRVCGVISSSVAKHSVDRIAEENNTELGMVTNRAAPTVNNGVIVSLLQGSVWTVRDSCYLTSLTIDRTSHMEAPRGKCLEMWIDGVQQAVGSGTYAGKITLKVVG